MMQQAIDRSAHTGGSFATSVVLHIAALLLLTFTVGREAAQRLVESELNEIAYIEARYGEDVAEKVKLKKPGRPGPPGPGITTDSAVRKPGPAEVAAPEPATPEPAPAQLQPRQAPAPAPRLEPQARQPERPALAAAVVPAVAPAQASRKELARADQQLEARMAPAPSRQVLDDEELAASLAGELADRKDTAPRAASPRTREAFRPQNPGLRDRGGRAPVGSGPAVAAAGTTRRGGTAVAEAPAALSGGGLADRGTGGAPAYESPRAALAPQGTARGGVGGGAAGVLDVDGPDGSSGASGAQTGRKTILDYGSGSGGGGGGLGGRRGRLAEVPTSRGIVDQATGGAEEQQPRVAEAATDLSSQNGVGMTISGQIAGRKILHRAAPEYTARARREGWEGMVAVHFTVLPDGRVKDNVYFEQTSVHRDLNQAAMAAIRKFRFAPLASDKAAVEQWGVITIVFRLH